MSKENKTTEPRIADFEPKMKTVKLSEIFHGKKEGIKGAERFTTFNVRDIEKNFDFSKGADKQLLDSIRAEGLKDHVVLETLAEPIDGFKYIRLKGNRRIGAIEQLAAGVKEGDRPAYDLHFANGVKCIVYPPLPEKIRWTLIADHQYMKKLSPLEQYYTVVKLLALGWTGKEIAEKVTGSMSFVNRCVRIKRLGDSSEQAAIDLYDQIIDRLKGVEGVTAVPDAVLTAVAQSLNADKGKYDGSNEAFTGLNAVEIIDKWQSGGETTTKMRSKSDIEKRLSVETDPAVIDALKWVLGQAEWETEAAE